MSLSPCRVLIVCSVLGLVGWSSARAADAPTFSPDAIDFFEHKIRPVLLTSCMDCHGPGKAESGLRLDSRAAVLAGGDSGPAAIPGRPEESLLIEAVHHAGFIAMPPQEQLGADDVEALEKWVRIGLPWPNDDDVVAPGLGDQEYIQAQAQSHWSFRPVVKPEPPTVKTKARLTNPIDRFVEARLESEGLSLAEPADPATLLRRMHFVLTGLPPSAEEVESFTVAYRKNREAAVEAEADRLLDSPHYGERWAQHWLDIARYADTRDWQAQQDPRYPFAFTYRDWVIDSLNADRPYDDFIRQQLAADLMTDSPGDPNLAALGFLTVGPRFRNNAQEQIADRIDVVTRGLMGITVTCARCHDHKYDPVPTTDYYALYGVFASTEMPEVQPLLNVSHNVSPKMLESYEAERAKAIQAKVDYEVNLVAEAVADLQKRPTDYLLGWYEMGVLRKADARSLISKRKVKETAQTPLSKRMEVLRRQAPWKRDAVMGPLFSLVHLPKGQFAKELKATLASPKLNPVVREALETKPPADAPALVAVYGDLFSQAQSRWQALPEKDRTALADKDWEAIRQVWHSDEGPFVLEQQEVVSAARLLGTARRIQGDLDQAILEVDATHPGAPPRAMAVVDSKNPITPTVFLRGDPRRRGDRVNRRFLTALSEGEPEPFTEGSGRLELADCVVDPENPLTPRSIVNQVWRHHFGTGFVTTPGDFGLRSDPPSHPELMDWLAASLIEHNWSLKWLHKQIVLSATFQQAGRIGPAAERGQKADPENRLLWAYPRRRLDFEALRDSVLVASGELDTSVGGRSVDPTEETEEANRRSLYLYKDRVVPNPVPGNFDVPSGDATSPDRPETLVPQQALYLMNDAFVVEQARGIVHSAEFQALKDDVARTQYIYRHILGRQARPVEITLTRRYVDLAAEDPAAVGSQWQYGTAAVDEATGQVTGFRPLPHFTGDAYQGGPELPDPEWYHLRLSADGGHPGRNSEQAVVRRWFAPRDMTVNITGPFQHTRKGGDGLLIMVLTDGRILGQWDVFNQKVDTKVDAVSVREGQAVDFVVLPKKVPSFDAFGWVPRLRSVETGTVWDAKMDFAGPPPPPLNPWEQVSQALIMSNEFQYVD